MTAIDPAHPSNSPRVISALPGQEVPPQTSGKAKAAGAAGGAGAAIGTILTALIVGQIGDLSPDVHAAISVLGGTIGAGIAAWAGAFYQRNYLK